MVICWRPSSWGAGPAATLVALFTDGDDPVLGADPHRNNEFSYAEDRLGFACPRGAHIRRAGPRDGAASNHRRLLLRRGLPYGTELPEGAPDVGVLI